GRGRAHTLLDQATTLATQLPATAALHNQGLLDELRLHAIHRGLENVPPTLLPTLEPLFLPHAARMNPAALTRTIRRLAQDHNPESLTTRHGRARKNRTVWFTPLPDGMAQLGATLDAVIAKSLYDSLDLWARTAQHQGTPSTATT
ncbi:DUF222 domain-containing protein, partial [Specibacter sp. RAF43]|uniref:DUF222 domain-containing protein n=1 Tax=Specibacter sp. RAF43 TaxID=3233057 RepID=UPI003F9A16B6